MNSIFFIALLAAFAAFLIPALIYNRLASRSRRFNSGLNVQNMLFIPFAGILFVISSFLYFTLYNQQQFLTSLSYTELAVPFIMAGIICLLSVYNKTSRFFPLFLLAGTIAATFAVPSEAIAAATPLPAFYNRLIICLAWFVFSYAYRYANTGDAMLSIQSIIIAGGIGILGLIDAIPLLLGILGFVFTAGFVALLVFNWPPARLSISADTASCFGFLLFALCVWTAAENAGSCVAIYMLYFLLDLVWALLLRFSFIEKYSNFIENTAYRQAIAEGVSPQSAATFAFRAQILLIFLGCFQALADNQTSLLLVSSLITIWLLYRFRSISIPVDSFKDINKQVLDDLQDRVNDIKQYINKGSDF